VATGFAGKHCSSRGGDHHNPLINAAPFGAIQKPPRFERPSTQASPKPDEKVRQQNQKGPKQPSDILDQPLHFRGYTLPSGTTGAGNRSLRKMRALTAN
jgi:hypothetical protein